ncbi:protein of unknown function [Methylorubrum extorquens DM4]|uniref:Uncharacterized protein n=1 Tax=Methylorubrum extorquens (strain DSM 6343 / CIP 106787 / DM4) TaxID=661410 RepID=C7CLX6_METED|nr:protein of unknown function [Methylorubrum extorquens DM4]
MGAPGPGTFATMLLWLGALELSSQLTRPPDPDYRRFPAGLDRAKCLKLGTARRAGSADMWPRQQSATCSSPPREKRVTIPQSWAKLTRTRDP